MTFVRVLSWSRRIFLRFYLDARMENFLRGHTSSRLRLGPVCRESFSRTISSLSRSSRVAFDWGRQTQRKWQPGARTSSQNGR